MYLLNIMRLYPAEAHVDLGLMSLRISRTRLSIYTFFVYVKRSKGHSAQKNSGDRFFNG